MLKKYNFSRHIAFFLFIITLSLGIGCTRPPKPLPSRDETIRPPQNIVLITIDTLRADHLACYGNSHIQTPTIDSLAQEGIRFEWAFTPVPITLPSHTSILTGLYPCTHGVLNNGEYQLSASIQTLPHILQSHGFTTAAFVGAFVLSRQFGLAQGFDVYDDELSPTGEKINEAFPLYNERKGEKVTAAALHWLQEKNPARFFLWVHYFDPHTPYDPPQPYKSEYADRLYDGEIAYTDQCIKGLLQELEKRTILKDTLVVLVGDHGQGLGEHKEKTHGIFLYDTTMRVPLLFRYPELAAGIVSSDTVKTIDIAPTILQLLNIPLPPQWQGESLFPYFYQPQLSHRKNPAIFLESIFPEANFGWSPLQGIRTREWKYIKAPRPELYDLENDPAELANVLDQYPKQAQKLESRLQKLLNTLPSLQKNQTVPMNEETRKRLQSLGYIWTADSATTPNLSQDPKDMIELLNIFDQGYEYYVAEHYPEAVAIFQQILQKDPDNIIVHFLLAASLEKLNHLTEALKEFQEVAHRNPRFNNVHGNIGKVYERLGNYQKALEEYQEDIKLFPDAPLLYNNIGVIYLRQKLYHLAIEQFEKVISLTSDQSAHIITHTNLGTAYEMLGMYPKAQEEYQRSLELDPNYLVAHINAGNVFLKTHQIEKAIQSWQKALEIDPYNVNAHYSLSRAYVGQQSFDKAIDHLQEVIRLEPDFIKARLLLEKIQKSR
ncbi:MAG: sulfatase-like hydrolase/transferase [Deltaproteobacteria bacterium]|nr:sulfatase-like hydrolase/transferase [Deltaproteobacteria bacterium]